MKTWIGRLLSNYKKKESLSEQAEVPDSGKQLSAHKEQDRMAEEEKPEYHVYLTSDTMRGILLEAYRHPNLECIVQMAGLREGNAFYFDLVSDSGIHATYQAAMCEKDHEYTDHLCTRLSEYYEIPAGRMTVSQIHKHPPGCRRFSSGDGPANRSLSRQFGGVVNGLIWVDPKFHMQFWYIDEAGNETEVPYTVDNRAVREAMPKKKVAGLTRLVELRESMGRVSSGKTDLLFQRTEFPGQEETGRKTELERRLRDLTIRVRNGQGHERFQTEDADLSVSEMTALNGALTEEMGALSYFTDLYVAKAGKNLLSVSAPEKDGKIRSVFFAAVDRRLYLLKEDKEYQEGDLRRLLEMEGEDHGEYTGIVSDDGRRTGGFSGTAGGEQTVYGTASGGVPEEGI